MKKIILLLLLITVSVYISGCGATKLSGIYESDIDYLEFANGKVRMLGNNFYYDYEIKDNKLSINKEGKYFMLDVIDDGKTLVWWSSTRGEVKYKKK
ncbi:hypothetical protein [Anaerospora sp.]|uniref:hypothetical protein n=1 Tax=Anaerospora sp. TaxID=1960278 RepID=UPI002898FFE3|nr:hypothetical protein [Anaerospora sp.]